jgi:hypothetical protein
MKSYVTEDQYRLVGKAWEIRHQLKRMTKEASPGQTLGDYLTSRGVKPVRSSRQTPLKRIHL